MKRLLTLLLALLLTFFLAACGGSSGESGGKSETPQGGSTTPDISSQENDNDTYPRYTGFDGTPYVAAANLQNCHILYTYDAECLGDPSSNLTGEYMTCLGRQYFRTYSLYGYDRHINGNSEYSVPDNHRAYVFTDGSWTVYDFYRKIIATGGSKDYFNGGWSDGNEISSFSNSTLRYWELSTENFVPSTEGVTSKRLDAIDGKTICGKLCNGWMRYDTAKLGNTEVDTYDYRLWVDPETHLTLRYEWYSGEHNLSEVSQIFEVTNLELNRVTQKDFDTKVAELVNDMGGESKFNKMTWEEYWELFE